LLLAKVQVGHGKWLAWLRDNCTFSERQARRYIQVACRWAELEANRPRVADLSLRGALELLNQAEKEFVCPVCRRRWTGNSGTAPAATSTSCQPWPPARSATRRGQPSSCRRRPR